ncbi:threonine--tRNA ligase [Candidatus Wolfebacteria bacterium RIFCSPHIGHO2_01_FULL_48_22]|uniref:Threonine--tRNA ligase n=1 Tax=Candidatus Wolfebacteria bacterium RIFCSPHIGHO2_01_FULL_48_22 TaxID=1802555 RepID=A0A1F8DRL2_9BACT|nr:MAG: threonine--tRNA ligase [Candidatus Wolfebacteria bacterium RIFCSPHIGHO2_01_FULL_48_22]
MKKNSAEDAIFKARHSLSHLLAIAVLEAHPKTKLAIGPVIENGFYYDFDLPTPLSDADLPALEKRVRELVKEKIAFKKSELTSAGAKKLFKQAPYKLELVQELIKNKKKITEYTSGAFTDLCLGPHVKSTSEINPDAFKLTHVAGAYWRGDEKNKMLTRIYGVAFATKKELDEYLALQEEARKRDHKKLGVELDLFTFSPLVGSGLPLWTPKGSLVRNLLDDFVWKLRKDRGYEQVDIPHLTKKDLYEKSGHWDKFKDELFRFKTREGHEFALKPMNCPHHTQIYARKPHSYRDLPQRYANTTKVYRDEQSGEIGGLSRVRSITQDDAHVFCRKNQVKEEMGKIWDIIQIFYEGFGFKLTLRLSLSDPKNMKAYIGDAEVWKESEKQLRDLVRSRKASAIEAPGEAAFYGPKLDFIAKDSLGREWQVATIQLDMNMPERFNLVCTNEKGKDERIVMIHAAIMGSIERFLAVLIEHLAGSFPTWLSPLQVALIPISDKHISYAMDLQQELEGSGIRMKLFSDNETLGKRIRQAELEKIPYMLVFGDKEIEKNVVNVRSYHKDQLGEQKIDTFVQFLSEEIRLRKNQPTAWEE